MQRQKDRKTDGQTDNVKTLYPPKQMFCFLITLKREIEKKKTVLKCNPCSGTYKIGFKSLWRLDKDMVECGHL